MNTRLRTGEDCGSLLVPLPRLTEVQKSGGRVPEAACQRVFWFGESSLRTVQRWELWRLISTLSLTPRVHGVINHGDLPSDFLVAPQSPYVRAPWCDRLKEHQSKGAVFAGGNLQGLPL